MASIYSTTALRTDMRRALPIVLLGLAAGAALLLIRGNEADTTFPGVEGPLTATTLPDSSQYRLDREEHRRHGTNAMAILVTDPEASWYGLVSGLLGIGIPYRLVDSIEEALDHQVILVYPVLSGASGTSEELQALATHVRQGGTLVGFSVLGRGLQELFGFSEAVESRFRSLEFQATPLTSALIPVPGERSLALVSEDDEVQSRPAVSYSAPRNPPLAVYDDGSPAIVQNTFPAGRGTGRAIAIGVDFGHLILRAHNGRFSIAGGSYVNAYRPGTDTLLRLLAAIYREGEKSPVLLSPTPDAREVTVLMTHDIDFTSSIENALEYATLEAEAGVPATYFIQTKYVKDYNDDLFFTQDRADVLLRLNELGMEIASHSVSHSNEFRAMPLGTGREHYPEYRPFVETFTSVRDASVAGELRVSRFLLEAIGPQTVHSFRPGHLSLPVSLPQMLEATGYRYSSTVTANEAMTHLPFRAMYDRGYHAPVGVWEFPVTIEDEAGDLYSRLESSIELTRAVARYRGLVNVLVHTDALGPKLDFVRDYIEAVRGIAWFGTMREYGDWWRVRETASLEVMDSGGTTRTLRVRVDGRIEGLTLELPSGWRYVSGPPGTRAVGSFLILGPLEGEGELIFTAPPS